MNNKFDESEMAAYTQSVEGNQQPEIAMPEEDAPKVNEQVQENVEDQRNLAAQRNKEVVKTTAELHAEREEEIRQESIKRGIGQAIVPVESLPSKGLFYPAGTKIWISSASLGDIKRWSSMNEDDIQDVMEKMGFHEKWIQLVMKCITTVSYSVIINGAVHGCIFPTRGLRQGDPLSPYLFLLCADGFSSLINEAVRNQGLSGISICRGCPLVSHLFFADNSLLFCKASEQECRKMIEILEL